MIVFFVLKAIITRFGSYACFLYEFSKKTLTHRPYYIAK